MKEAILDRDNIQMTDSFPKEVHFTVDLKIDAPDDLPNRITSTKFEFDATSIYAGHAEFRRVMAILRNY